MSNETGSLDIADEPLFGLILPTPRYRIAILYQAMNGKYCNKRCNLRNSTYGSKFNMNFPQKFLIWHNCLLARSTKVISKNY